MAVSGLGLWSLIAREPTTDFRMIRDLEPGTCFWRKDLAAEEWGAVRVVPCDDRWQFALLNTHWIQSEGSFPDEAFFYQQAGAHCETGWTFILSPTLDGWRAGDRLLLCLTEPGALPPRA